MTISVVREERKEEEDERRYSTMPRAGLDDVSAFQLRIFGGSVTGRAKQQGKEGKKGNKKIRLFLRFPCG